MSIAFSCLLPIDVVSITEWETEEVVENFNNIKQMLLKRYKLNAEIFRLKFMQHLKLPLNTWKDYAFELRNSLNEWLSGVQVSTHDELKDFLTAEHIKRHAEIELRDHFLYNDDKLTGNLK